MSLLSPIISSFFGSVLNPFSREPEHAYGRLTIRILASLLLISAYVFSCIALYNYLAPCVGNDLSLIFLCLVFLATSLVLFTIGWCLKPRKTMTSNISSVMEKTMDHLPTTKDLNQAVKDLSPSTLVGCIVAIGVISYLVAKK